jgi:hypothetical protein
VKIINAGKGTVASCAVCGGALHGEKQRVAPDLAPEMARAYGYPFTPAAAIAIVATFVLCTFVSFVPLVGGALSVSIMVAFFFLVLRATAEGQEGLASDFELDQNIWLWFSPLARYLLTLLVAFAPAALGYVAFGPPLGAIVAIGGAVLGVVYLPAGMIVAAHAEGCFGPLNPTPAIRIIGRIPGPYFLTLGFMIVSALVGAALGYVAKLLGGAIAAPLVPALIARALGFYAPTVMARQLGILMREHSESL